MTLTRTVAGFGRTGSVAGHDQRTPPEQIRDQLVERAASVEPDLADLVRLYFRYVPAEEVMDDNPVDLLGAVRSHHQLAQSRVPGRPAVRVFNPTRVDDGWSCPA